MSPRLLVFVAALALSAPFVAAAAQQSGSQAETYAEPNAPIVVTGIRIQDYRDRLAACLARNCPPNEDIDATLALAEAQLLEGDYRGGRQTVRDSLHRNRRHVRAFPEPVSDLYRADSRLARHTGNDQQALRSTYGILESLQAGIAREDYRHFTARLELADMLMMMGRLPEAKRELRELAEIARTNGRPDVATMAALRGHWYDYLADPRGPTRARLTAMMQSNDPAHRMEAIGARILLSRIYRANGDTARADALLAELGRGPSSRRRLIHAPTYQLTQGLHSDSENDLEDAFGRTDLRRQIPPNYEGKWIDVGFWVQPDGRVEGLEILRSGGDTSWADPLVDSIRGRLYSTAEEPTYRLERYTFTAERETLTGSHIRRNGARARVEYIDLTTADPPPPPGQPGTRPN